MKLLLWCMIATLLSAEAAARSGMREVMVEILEDADCNGNAVPSPKDHLIVLKRKPIHVADELLSPTNPRDAYISGRLHLNDQGEISGVDVFQQLPMGYAMAKMFERGFKEWTFAPGMAGEFCASLMIDFEPKQSVWGQVAYPNAPHPTSAEPLAYPEAAFTKGISGLVEMLVEISPMGNVDRVALGLEDPKGLGFAEAAIEGVKTWRFDGAAAGRYRLKVRFKPDSANAPPVSPAK